MDASVVAMKRKNFADFLRKSFFSKNFCVQAPGGSPKGRRRPAAKIFTKKDFRRKSAKFLRALATTVASIGRGSFSNGVLTPIGWN